MDESTTAAKACCNCGELKPLGAYHKFFRSPDGRQAKCKSCCAEYQRTYNLQHSARRAAARAEQAAANRERERASKALWSAANPERRMEIKLRRRARKLAATIGTVDLNALWTGLCGICDGPMDRGLSYPDPLSKSVDHIIPLARGGTHEQENLAWAHLICNVSKGAKMPDQAA